MIVSLNQEGKKKLNDLNITYGKLPIRIFLVVYPILIWGVCLLCYYVAVSKGEVKPFPNCTITNTATPYPQNIIFRFIMLPASVFFILMWLTIYYMLTQYQFLLPQAKASNYDIIFWCGAFGAFFYSIAMATIDSGKMAGTLHSVSAVIFFILYMIIMVMTTQELGKLRKKDPKIISYVSLLWKQISTFLMVLLWIVEIILLIIGLLVNGTPKEICIVEWGSVLFLCLYLFSFSFDWKDYHYVLDNTLKLDTINEVVNDDQSQLQQQGFLQKISEQDLQNIQQNQQYHQQQEQQQIIYQQQQQNTLQQQQQLMCQQNVFNQLQHYQQTPIYLGQVIYPPNKGNLYYQQK